MSIFKNMKMEVNVEQPLEEKLLDIMKVYRINYFAPLHITDLDDTYIAKSKFEAVKAFLVKYKGKYLIHSVFEV